MARDSQITHLRTTFANLNTQAGLGGLRTGELYLVTDLRAIAIGISTTDYELFYGAPEVGSNANGQYIKHDNGQLECFHTVSVSTTVANNWASTTWTFPVPAVSGSWVNLQATLSNIPSNQLIMVGASASLTTGTIYLNAQGAVTANIAVSLRARWK